MKKINKLALVLSIITFMLSSFFYEWYVEIWAATEIGAIIRVDILIVYPIFILLAFGIYFLFKKPKTTFSKALTVLFFILFWMVVAGMFKFNILANMTGYDVDGNPVQQEPVKTKISEDIKPAFTTGNLPGSWLDTSERALHFTLFKDGTARSDNMQTLLYQKWRVEGDSLILTVESIGNGNTSVDEEGYKIELLNDSTLVLKKGEYIERYVKKTDG